MILLLTLFFLVGLIEVILGIPLLFEKIKPNWIYGFRTPKTMSDKKIWYDANKYSGRDLIIIGFIVVVGTLFLFLLRDGLSYDVIGYIGIILLVIPLFVLLIRGLAYIRRL